MFVFVVVSISGAKTEFMLSQNGHSMFAIHIICIWKKSANIEYTRTSTTTDTSLTDRTLNSVVLFHLRIDVDRTCIILQRIDVCIG